MKKSVYKVLFCLIFINLCIPVAVDAQETGIENEPAYTPDAVKIFEDGSYITGAGEIRAWWAGLNNKIREYEILEIIPSHQPEKIRYELSSIILANGRVFNQLIIWNLEEAVPRRELEVVVEKESLEDYTFHLDARRAGWMRLCNAHNAVELVDQLYTDNALYYNHKPLVKGRQAIASEYGYMNSPAYNLTLTPIRVLPVSPEVAFEIGQCSGSYGGKYVLVWQKGEDGTWRIMLDANI